MSIYAGIGNAAVSQGGNYLNPGHGYLLEVLRAFNKAGRKGETFFIAEFLVHRSDDVKIPAGSQASWVVNFRHEAALGNVLCFLGAVNGINPKDEALLKQQITTQVAEYAVSAANPLAGKMVEVRVQTQTTKSNNPFSKHFWTPTTEGPIESARAAARARVNGNAGTFPPSGWQQHPQSPAHWYKGSEIKTEAELRAMMAPPPSPTPSALPGLTAPLLGGPPPISAPTAPALPAAPSLPVFPPSGWQQHPQSAAHWFKGNEIKTEAELRATMAPPVSAPALPQVSVPIVPSASSPVLGLSAPPPIAPPSLPMPMGVPALPAAPSLPVFPPPGWQQHPQSAAHWFKGSEIKTEAELRAMG